MTAKKKRKTTAKKTLPRHGIPVVELDDTPHADGGHSHTPSSGIVIGAGGSYRFGPFVDPSTIPLVPARLSPPPADDAGWSKALSPSEWQRILGMGKGKRIAHLNALLARGDAEKNSSKSWRVRLRALTAGALESYNAKVKKAGR